jgi:hypothetical protein
MDCRTVLVIGSVEDRALWKRLFDELPALSDGTKLSAVVGDWDSLFLTSFASDNPRKRLQVQIKEEGSHFVEFVVVRKLCRGLNVNDDHRNKVGNDEPMLCSKFFCLKALCYDARLCS